jgi:hypothetical protein
MIEVVQDGHEFAWRMICAAGRTLVESPERFPCDFTAFAAARRWRTDFWARADQVDHRMGACL